MRAPNPDSVVTRRPTPIAVYIYHMAPRTISAPSWAAPDHISSCLPDMDRLLRAMARLRLGRRALHGDLGRGRGLRMSRHVIASGAAGARLNVAPFTDT